jgi:hypothetical protein
VMVGHAMFWCWGLAVCASYDVCSEFQEHFGLVW